MSVSISSGKTSKMLTSLNEFTQRHFFKSKFFLPLSVYLLYKLYQRQRTKRRISRPPSHCYILITGCGSGFERETAILLDKLGCHVFAGCRSENGLKELDEITSERCRVFQMDVTKSEDIQSALELVQSTIPAGQGLWALINNAGIAGSRSGLPEWSQASDFEECMNVNLFAYVTVTRTFLPLIKSCQGRILLVSSMYGRVAYPAGMPYAAPKYATEAYGDGLRDDVRDENGNKTGVDISFRRSLQSYGVKVILIEPGIYHTNIATEENLTICLKNAWEALTPEERGDYGEDYLRKYTEFIIKQFHLPFFNKVTAVAEAMEAAIFCQYPKACYPVGNDSKFFQIPMTYLPEWASDWLIEKLVKSPKPTSLLKNNRH